MLYCFFPLLTSSFDNADMFCYLLQAWAWEAREYLRKKLVGKEVSFTVEYKVPGTGKEFGCVYLGKGNSIVVEQLSLDID